MHVLCVLYVYGSVFQSKVLLHCNAQRFKKVVNQAKIDVVPNRAMSIVSLYSRITKGAWENKMQVASKSRPQDPPLWSRCYTRRRRPYRAFWPTLHPTVQPSPTGASKWSTFEDLTEACFSLYQRRCLRPNHKFGVFFELFFFLVDA